MGEESGRKRYWGVLCLLSVCALLLLVRVIYLYLADPQRFPINTVKVSASFQHITRKQLETTLSLYLKEGFFMFSTGELQEKLMASPWIKSVEIDRVWPDSINIKLKEHEPYAIWNKQLITEDGRILSTNQKIEQNVLPQLRGAQEQQSYILQSYKKFSKLLSDYGLQLAAVDLQENQAWVLTLTNGIQLNLGKLYSEERLVRFCRTYPVLIADRSEQLLRVDLRYSHGLAVHWKKERQDSAASSTIPQHKREDHG